MNDDEDDIYNDLPGETTSDYIAKIENKLESVQKQYDESQTLIKELNIEKHNNQKRIKELEKTVEYLGRNMSSLYKTAVAEIKRRDNTCNELRAERDDIAFRRRAHHRNKSTNCDQGRIRDHIRDREKHRKVDSPVEEKDKHSARHSADNVRCKRLDSPVEEKYKYWPRNNADIGRCKKSADSRSRYDERQRLEVKHEKRSSSDRNDYRNGEFHSQERHHRTKMMDIKERHSDSISPRDRIKNPCDIRNRPEMQESFPLAKRERRSSPENYPKLYTISTHVKKDPDVQNSLLCGKNEYRNSNEKYPKSEIISSYAKNASELQNSLHDGNEYRNNQEIYVKSDIVSLSVKTCAEIQNSLQYDEYKQRNSREKYPRSQIVSSSVKNSAEMQNILPCDENKLRNGLEKHPKSQIVSSSAKNSAEVQNILPCDENKHRNSLEKYPKPQIVSSSVKNSAEMQNILPCDENKLRNGLEKHPKSQIVSSSVKNSAEMQNILQRDENKHRNGLQKYPKPQIVSSSVKSSSEVQNSLKHDENKHRNSQEKYSKSQIVSSSVKNSVEVQNSLRYDRNELRNGQEMPPKSLAISSCPKNGSEAQNNIQRNNNEHQKDQEKHLKSQSIPTRVKKDPLVKNDLQLNKTDHRKSNEKPPKLETASLGMKNVPEPKTIPIINQHKSLCGRIEKTSVENTSNKEASLHFHKNELHTPPKLANPSTIAENSPTGVDTRTGNCSKIENNLKTANSTVPDQSKKSSSRVADRLEALFDSNDDNTSRDVPISDQNENHSPKETTEEILDQMSNFMRCEAALRSMKKRPRKLLTPMKPTPDLLKQKYSQIEQAESKKNPVIPMINEKRMLSPYKNVCVVEIIRQNADDVEPSKSAESEPVAACSVTVTENIEHGVFARKSRKRPRIQKIFTAVKKVSTS